MAKIVHDLYTNLNYIKPIEYKFSCYVKDGETYVFVDKQAFEFIETKKHLVMRIIRSSEKEKR